MEHAKHEKVAKKTGKAEKAVEKVKDAFTSE